MHYTELGILQTASPHVRCAAPRRYCRVQQIIFICLFNRLECHNWENKQKAFGPMLKLCEINVAVSWALFSTSLGGPLVECCCGVIISS